MEQGSRLEQLPVSAGVTPDEVADFATSPPSVVVRIGETFFPAHNFEEAIGALCASVAAHHAAHPLEAGIERAQLVGGKTGPLADAALLEAERRGLLVSRGSLVAMRGFAPAFSGRQQTLRDDLIERLRAGGLAPPTVNELSPGANSAEVRAVLRLLEAQGEVVGVASDLYLHAPVLARAIQVVRTQGAGRALSAAEFKAALPVSRKYLIPILEYLDRTGVTKREGDLRWVQIDGTPESA
jgi:selenocysteine-specific elongation factor